QGPLVRSLDSYAAYYAKWSAVWEAQALLRADPIIGDPSLCERFRTLIDPLRFPEQGLGPADVREIRRIKARIDSERLPRGADPAPRDPRERAGVAHICGYPPGESGAMVNDYLRVTRRARLVVDRLFWD